MVQLELPLVSIIIPYYNKKSTINRSVQSIINQTYENWEIIIIDDNSSEVFEFDSSWNNYNIRYVKNEFNLGAGQARQRGQSLAKGDYIAFLDADDYWEIKFLEFCVDNLVKTFNNAGVYVKSLVKLDDGIEYVRNYSDLGLLSVRETLLKYARPWQTGGILWRKTCLGEWGNLKTNEDSWFEFTSSRLCNSFSFINEVLYVVDASGSNHLSKEIGKEQSVIDQQDLFIMVYTEFWDYLSFKYKIVLLNRLIRGQLKIHEYCSDNALVMGFKLNKLNPILFVMHKNVLLLKIIHKILQKSPFNIHF